MANYIIMAVLAVVVLLAFKSAARHLRGEGGCCGGGGETVKAERKELRSPVLAEKILTIGGMSCANCAARVQNALNAVEGAAAEVNLKNGTARVRISRPAADGELRAAVARAGYEVLSEKDAQI